MRFVKVDAVLSLALEMQASRMGISLSEIESRFHVGRRTAQRMKDAVGRVYPQMERIVDEERHPRWRIPSARVAISDASADEIADLEAAAKVLRRDNQRAKAKNLENLATKLRAALKPAIASRLAPDLEALMEAEGIAMRPGPRPYIDDQVIGVIRRAILQGRSLYIAYRRKQDFRSTGREVHPLGFLFGKSHYLVAIDPKKDPNKPRLFALGNIIKASVAEKTFERPAEFSLEAFSRNSFGVYQEEPVDVEWRFKPVAATAARDFFFHPSQKIELKADGSVIVRFRAGGLLEMCWHLYTWGRDVEVLKPAKLKELMPKALKHSAFQVGQAT